jgi:predicted DNA-binding transcriptional regulator AlpA
MVVRAEVEADVRSVGVPSYVSRARMAQELDCAPSTIDEMVRRGILPKPVKLLSHCVRWRWAEVEMAIDLIQKAKPRSDDEDDPIMRTVNDPTTD